jgi:hypothetical protein
MFRDAYRIECREKILRRQNRTVEVAFWCQDCTSSFCCHSNRDDTRHSRRRRKARQTKVRAVVTGQIERLVDERSAHALEFVDAADRSESMNGVGAEIAPGPLSRSDHRCKVAPSKSTSRAYGRG